MKKLLAVVFAGLSLTGFSTTWSVDLANGDDAAARADKTGATAFKTIQAAIDNAVKNDTVKVGPGVYDTGAKYIGDSATGDGGNTRCRVVIDKTLTLIGAGRDKTFIVGASDPDGNADGCGDNAIRCIGVASTAGTSTVIQGFTICDGRTSDGPNIGSSGTTNRSRVGGGVFAIADFGCTVIDCTIKNCGAVQAGAAHRAVLVRCKLFDNLTYVEGKTCSNWPMGSVSRYCKHYWCEIAGSRNSTGVYDPRGVVNCTFHSSGVSDIRIDSNNYNGIYNCVFDHHSNNRAIEGTADYHPNARNCVIAGGAHPTSTLTDCVERESGMLFAPALRDGHLVNTATDCFGIADPRAIVGDDSLGKISGIPEAYRWTDLDGNPVPQEAGKINPGCYQTPKTPVGGKTSFFGDGNLDLYVDGNFIRHNSTNYFYTASWPTQHTFKAVSITAGKEFLCSKTSRNGGWFYPMLLPVDKDNFCRFMPASAGYDYIFECYSASQYWIDCHSTAEDPDGSEAKPFKTFAAAVSGKNDSVYRVKAGTYDSGEYENTVDDGGYKARMGLKKGSGYRFIAEEGAEKTILVGASDPDVVASERGCGPKAVRLVGFTEGSAMSYFHGFTLTGGRSSVGTQSGTASSYKALGAVCRAQMGGDSSGWKTRSLLTDCIITNNVSGHSPFGGAQTVRCLIADNHVIGEGDRASLCYYGYASGCIFRNNTATTAIWGSYQVSIQCTMDDLSITNPFNDCNAYNCVVRVNPSATSKPRNYRGTVRVGYTPSDAGSYPYTVYSEDPFADAVAGDYRLLDASTAAHFGISKIGDNDMYETWVRNFPSDFYGNPLAFDDDGRLAPGALQERAVGLAVKVDATYGHGIDAKDFARLDAEGKVTLTATETDKRVLKCFEVNGVAQPTAGTTFTYVQPTPAPEKDDVVTAVYYTDFYTNPDPTVGSDANTGCDPNAPALTLSNALSHCVAGDTVHAAPGVYDQNATLYSSTEYFDTKGDICVWTRAYVPEGVTLEATGSREETIIKGAPSPEAYDGDYGCGPWATRCAVLREKAVLRGFTLTDGHSATKPHGGSEDGKSGDNQSCGGALVWNNACLENCVVSNCVSGRSVIWGKNGNSCVVRNCVVAGNRDLQNSLGLLRTVFVDGCYVVSNISYSLCYFTTKCANTTFGPGNTGSSEAGYREASLFRGSDNKTNEIVNSVIHTRNLVDSNQKIKMTRCVFDSEIGSTSRKNLIETTDCIETTRDKMAFEPNGAPVVGTNPAVDAGTLSDWTGTCPADTDVWGNQRVYNGRVDIGAVEADWRPVYARTLCRSRRLSVTEADPAVFAATNASGAVVGVAVPADATLACAFADGPARPYSCNVELASGAALDLALNGATTTLTSSGTAKIDFPAAESELVFAAKDGLALLNPFVSLSGSLLLLR